MVRHTTIEATDWIRERYPLLADAAVVIADPLVRNRGTVGGSLVHADPAGDWGAVMLACRARLVARSAEGEREIPIDEFFLTTFATVAVAARVVLEDDGTCREAGFGLTTVGPTSLRAAATPRTPDRGSRGPGRPPGEPQPKAAAPLRPSIRCAA